MKPAFSSRRQAAAFALLLAALLGFHAFLYWTESLVRFRVNSSSSNERWILENPNDVDIAFLGSSAIREGVNAPYVQKALSEKLNREAEVFTFGWHRSGYDILYFKALDLLDHRRVQTMVIYNEQCPNANLHWESFRRWPQITDDPGAVRELAMGDKVGLYGASATAVPRFLLDQIRQDYPSGQDGRRSPSSNVGNNSDSKSLGAGGARNNYGGTRDFYPFKPSLSATPEDVLVYSPETRGMFTFNDSGPSPLQLHFARKFARLCQARGTHLVVIQIPFFNQLDRSTVIVNQPWQEWTDGSVAFIGIPNCKLFANIPTADLQKLFLDDWHLNLNGQGMFTELITPALIKVYGCQQ